MEGGRLPRGERSPRASRIMTLERTPWSVAEPLPELTDPHAANRAGRELSAKHCQQWVHDEPVGFGNEPRRSREKPAWPSPAR